MCDPIRLSSHVKLNSRFPLWTSRLCYVFNPSASSSFSFSSFSLSCSFSSSVSPAVSVVNFLTCWVCVCVCRHQNRLHLNFVFKPWGHLCPSTKGTTCEPVIRHELDTKIQIHISKPGTPVWTNAHRQFYARTNSQEINKLSCWLALSHKHRRRW